METCVRLIAVAILALPLARAAPAKADGQAIPEIAEAFRHLYGFEFEDTHSVLNAYISTHPREALPYAVRSAGYLFYELDRLGILEGQFYTDDDRIVAKKKLDADPQVRIALWKAIDETQSRALATLQAKPGDTGSLFAMSTAFGVASDYQALVEKRQIKSLSSTRQANEYAQRLLKLQPPFYDAYVSAGISEYLLGSLPFFIRWFVHFDNVQGGKGQAVQDLELVERQGLYLKPFARILLAIIYLREKKPERSREFLQVLAREFPTNPLYARELARLR